MSRPPINPDKSVSGIAVDPRTLDRIIPESRRPDGTVRKQIKIRPGYTPQEDVKRFRGTKQSEMDARQLPKGHVVGWMPPPSTTPASASGKPLSKSAKKNAKRKEKRSDKLVEDVKDNWDDDDEEEGSSVAPNNKTAISDAATLPSPDAETDALASTLEKLEVK